MKTFRDGTEIKITVNVEEYSNIKDGIFWAYMYWLQYIKGKDMQRRREIAEEYRILYETLKELED